MAEVHRYDRGRTLPILHRAELTTPQLATLEVLCEPKTVSSVASDLGLSMPATSQMIDKLVRKKLVRRTELSTDRRQRSVVLSAKGRALRATNRLGTRESVRGVASSSSGSVARTSSARTRRRRRRAARGSTRGSALMNTTTFLVLNLALAFYNVGTIWAHEVDIFRSWKPG